LQVGSFIFRISIVQRADQPGRVSEWLFYNFYIIKYLFPVQKHIVSGRMVCQVDAVYWKIYGFFQGIPESFRKFQFHLCYFLNDLHFNFYVFDFKDFHVNFHVHFHIC